MKRISRILGLGTLIFLLPLLLLFAGGGGTASHSWKQIGMPGVSLGGVLATTYGGLTRVYVWPVQGGLLRSVDDGKTWQSLGMEHARVLSLVASPDDPRSLYIALKAQNGTAALYRSTDGGESWSEILEQLEIASSSVSLAVGHGKAPFLFVLSGNTLAWSPDGGKAWLAASLPDARPTTGIMLAGKKDTLILGTDRGLWESNDQGKSWTADAEVPRGPVGTLWTLPQGSTCIVTTEAISCRTGGGKWVSSSPPPTAGVILGIGHPHNPSCHYILSDSGVWCRSGMNAPWTKCNKGLGGVPTGLSVAGNSLYAATDNGLWMLRVYVPEAPTPSPVHTRASTPVSPPSTLLPTATPRMPTATYTPVPTETPTISFVGRPRRTATPMAAASPSPAATKAAQSTSAPEASPTPTRGIAPSPTTAATQARPTGTPSPPTATPGPPPVR